MFREPILSFTQQAFHGSTALIEIILRKSSWTVVTTNIQCTKYHPAHPVLFFKLTSTKDTLVNKIRFNDECLLIVLINFKHDSAKFC